MRGAAESLIPPHAPVITHVWQSSRPPRTWRGVTRLSGRAEPGRQCPPPTDRTASGEGGREQSREDTSAGRVSLLEVLTNQKVHVCRSDGVGVGGWTALLGVPQQGGVSSCVSYSCSNTRLLRSACVPPVFTPLISHFPVCGSCSFMHPSPHPSPSPPPSIEVPPTSAFQEKVNSRGNGNTSHGGFHVAENYDSHDPALPG